MIVSASYKTDIPTFYGDWFMRRLEAGYCKVVNPYSRQPFLVKLDRSSVAGFVFWTKNVHPFLKHLVQIHERGFPFVVQHTINRYPRQLESSVVDADKSIESAWRLRELYGPRCLVWRYDTIVTSTLTPTEFHVENFRHLAGRLEGATDEVVVSFAQLYKKTARNLDGAASEHGFRWRDPSVEEKRRLLTELALIARSHRMVLSVCSQRDFIVAGSIDAKCVDATRLESVGGARLRARLKGNRTDCGCYESRDIGDYDTCPHGCVYCYAVQNRDLSLQRFRTHRVDSDFLFETDDLEAREDEGRSGRTLPLFKDR